MPRPHWRPAVGSRPWAVLTGAMVALVALSFGACSSSPERFASVEVGNHDSAPRSAITSAAAGIGAIRHVFLIVMENEGYASVFGDPGAFPYLAVTLPSQGVLLTNYYATGHASNDNYVALISGQPPNPASQADCLTFSDFSPGDGQSGGIEQGSGCVYPSQVPNLGNQLSDRGLTWKAYMQDMGNDPQRETAVCAHPAIGAIDPTEVAVPGDGYATRHDPFAYFHSIIDDPTGCAAHIVPLGSPTGGAMPAGVPPGTTGLATDLESPSTTPNFSLIVPNLCEDGHDFPCKNESGGASVGANVDGFLQTWVPLIMASPSFKAGGLIEITFDEASLSDATACCSEQPGPAAALPGVTGPGGGRVGAIVISPYVSPGTTSTVPYNHYSSLATFEDIFGLPRLGEARSAQAFGPDVLAKLAHRRS